jgi:ABC-type dipeptide/oligopeptide/nickel transport system permease component
MLEAASTSETSVNFYQTMWHNNPEDSHLHRGRVNSMFTEQLLYIVFIAKLQVKSMLEVMEQKFEITRYGKGAEKNALILYNISNTCYVKKLAVPIILLAIMKFS